MAWWIFQNIVVTAALALTVAMVCRTSRIGPVARHALWVLVLVKFVTPPLVVWPWAAPDPLGLARLDGRVDGRSVVGTLAVSQDAWAQPDVVAAQSPDLGEGFAPGDSRDRSMARAGAAAWPWLLGLWAAGSLCLLGIQGVRLARLARRVRAARPAHPAIVNRVAALSAHFGLRPIPVLTMADSPAPVVWCLGQPRLLWPADLPADSTDACIDGLLVHELAHVKRRDHLVGWIELIAGVIWWWNPLFWFVRSALREQAELACDAWVIAALPNGRRAYAESLLALSGATVRGTPAISMGAVVGIRASSRRVLERRLVMIMQGRAPLRLSFPGLLTLALAAAATLPAWAAGQQPPPPLPPTPAAQVATPVPPPPPPVARSVRVPQVRQRVTPQKPPPPLPGTKPQLPPGRWTVRLKQADLPEDGQKLVQGFEADRASIQAEADQKVVARRESLLKALQALQDQYAKEGKLDEAVAIRDYIRAGLPRGMVVYDWFRRQ